MIITPNGRRLDVEIRTTAGEIFTEAQTTQLAQLIQRRFGYDSEAAAAAWARMLQTDVDEEAFVALVIGATEAAIAGQECGGKFRNTAGKRAARCSRCGRVDYEANEGDTCRAPRLEAGDLDHRGNPMDEPSEDDPRCSHHASGAPCSMPTGHEGSHMFRCASPGCPGRTWPASVMPHPNPCGGPR